VTLNLSHKVHLKYVCTRLTLEITSYVKIRLFLLDAQVSAVRGKFNLHLYLSLLTADITLHWEPWYRTFNLSHKVQSLLKADKNFALGNLAIEHLVSAQK
jgi:hypothetical protein